MNKLQIESDNKSRASPDRQERRLPRRHVRQHGADREENVLAPDKWPTVRDTVCKVMRSLPDLEKFQEICSPARCAIFSTRPTGSRTRREEQHRPGAQGDFFRQTAEDTNLYAGSKRPSSFARGASTHLLFLGRSADLGTRMTPAQEKALTAESDRSVLLSRHIRRTLATSCESTRAR